MHTCTVAIRKESLNGLLIKWKFQMDKKKKSCLVLYDGRYDSASSSDAGSRSSSASAISCSGDEQLALVLRLLLPQLTSVSSNEIDFSPSVRSMTTDVLEDFRRSGLATSAPLSESSLVLVAAHASEREIASPLVMGSEDKTGGRSTSPYLRACVPRLWSCEEALAVFELILSVWSVLSASRQAPLLS